MTPGARISAAIEILDRIVEGMVAEAALTRWARASRFAGSKDRAAVRDHVFDVLRHWRSDAARGGGTSGRARMIGRLRGAEIDPAGLFTGEGHAPAPLTAQEIAAGAAPQTRGDAWDLPDWILPQFEQSLGADAERTAMQLRTRAPVTLRVNAQRCSRPDAIAALEHENIRTVPNDRAPWALTIQEGARQVRLSAAYRNGLVELQDASSQAVVEGLPPGRRVLDYCAGGGGKALALAAQGRDVTACDIDPARMQDLPERAARAGAQVQCQSVAEAEAGGNYDLVFCDAPCSGSGAWRRSPEGKWRLTPDRLRALTEVQRRILDAAMRCVAPGGFLAYATCSILRVENDDTVAGFLADHPGWTLTHRHQFPVDEAGDGFFAAHLTRVG